MAEPITEFQHCIARPVQGTSPLNPLTDEHFLQIRMAVEARRPVAAAVRTARFSANSTLVIGVLGVPVALFSPSWISIAMVVGICTIGMIERSGVRRLRQGQPSAATFLGRNQLAFLGLIVAYCIIQMMTFSGSGASEALISKDTRSALAQLPGQDITGQIDTWAPLAAYGFYGLVILLSVCFQGGLALYYFTRRRHLLLIEGSTPTWIRRVFTEVGV